MKKRAFGILLVTALFMSFSTISHSQLISVKIEPTPPAYERPAAPSPRHVWVDGEWTWQSNRYVWKPGYWTIPEPYKVWVKGYWDRKPNGTSRWVSGRWEATDEHIAVKTQPKPIVETRPAAPSPRHTWVDGEWTWQNNNYVWKKGYWTIPEPHKKWAKGYWTQRPNGTWYWVAGHWREY